VVEREEKIVVKTEVKGRIKCPHCGSGKLYGHGMCKPREILHTWSNGRRVYLESHRRRWKCRDCKRTFAQGRELVRSHWLDSKANALYSQVCQPKDAADNSMQH
jgi:transposase